MNFGTVKIVDRLSAVEAINQMSEEDLVGSSSSAANSSARRAPPCR